MSTFKTWDIETETNTLFKRKASPFHSDNWPVCHGIRPWGGEQHLHYFGMNRPQDGWLVPVLQGTRMIAGFNIKFDVLHAIHNQPKNLEAWMEYVAGGGLVWDCQLAEYLLNGMTQKDQMLSLDEVAPRYGGQLKHDEVKALWAAGVPTHQIDKDLLLRYLGGGEDGTGEYRPGDLENTETVAKAQILRAREAGQYNSIILNMGALLCSIEMERNGMFVDKEEGLRLAAILEVKVAELRHELQRFLPVLPFDFNWGSPRQKSALLFGGGVTYDSTEYLGLVTPDPESLIPGAVGVPLEVWWCSDRDREKPARWSQQYTKKDESHYVLNDGTTMSPDWWEHCYHTEWGGEVPESKMVARFAGGKQAGEKKTKKVRVDDLSKPKKRACKVVYTFPRLTTPNREWQSESDPGVYSTASDVIEELGTRDLPFLKALAKLQAMAKDLGTYYLTTDEKGVQKGMLTLVGPDGIIHQKINHTSTVTGRLSGSDPNLQNLPTSERSEVKSLFRSRWGADGSIIQSDFSSLEVYIQAILTGCKQLIEDLRAGVDMHCMRLAAKENRAYDEVLVLCKGDKAKGIEPVQEWKYKRTGTKEFSFQRAYGAGVKKIAATTGMTEEEVQALVDVESLRYPEIDEFYENLTEEIKNNRRPSSTFVPHPITKQMAQLGKSYYRTPDGKLYAYIESTTPEFLAKRGVLASFSPTEIRNYVVQGSGGEWMKAAMWLAVRAFYAVRNFGGLALLVNTVHDAAYTDAHNSVREKAAALLHACMESANDLIEYLFNWTLPVPVPSETNWGASMMEEQGIPGIAAAAAPLREQLRRDYMKGYVPTYLKERTNG